MFNSSIRVAPAECLDVSTNSLLSDDYFCVTVGREKKEFLLSDSYSHLKSDFEEQLKKFQAAVEWGEDPDRFGVRCLDHHADILNWRKDARDFVNHYFGCIVVQSIHGSLPLSLDFLQQGFGNTSVFISRDRVGTKIVGHKESAEKVHDKIQVIKDETSQYREIIQLKYLDAYIFVYCGICDELQSQFSNIYMEVYLENAEIVLTGCHGDLEDIKECRIVIDEQIAGIKTFDKLPVTSGRAVLLKTNRIKDYIFSCQRQSTIHVYWEIIDPCFLTLYATNEVEKEKCIALIEEEIVEKQVTYPESYSVSDVCEACQVHETKKNVSVDFLIDPVTRLIKVTATKEDMRSIMNDLQRKINAESVFCVMDLYSPWAFELVTENFSHNIKKVVSSSPCSVWKKESVYAFYIKGPANSIDSIRCEIGNIVMKIFSKYVSFESRRSLREIDDIMEKANRQKSLTVRRSSQCRMPSISRTIIVHAGSILDIDVDVIAVSSNQHLRMMGGLSNILSKKGGKSIQEECDKHIRENGKLEDGDFFLSNAGNLNCLVVAHIVGTDWKNKEHGRLGQAVVGCLSSINTLKFKSVAFPTLFSKINHLNAEVAVNTIVDAVNDHLAHHADSQIDTVVFCDVDNNNVKMFLDKVKATHWSCGVVFDQNIRSQYSSTYNIYSPDLGLHSAAIPSVTYLLPQKIGTLTVKACVSEISVIDVDVVVHVADPNDDKRLGRQLKSKGFVITEKGRMGLKCHTVLDLDVNSILKAKTIQNALETADKCRYTSIAVPVLTTGNVRKSLSEFLSTLYTVLEKFCHRSKNLKVVHLVTSSSENLQEVHTVLRKLFIESGRLWIPTYRPIPEYSFVLYGTSTDAINDGIELLKKSLC